MRLGRLFFAGAVLLALAYFALRAPVPVADPRFLKQEFLALGTLVSVSVYLEEGMSRERGHQAIADCETFLLGYEQTWGPWNSGLLGDINRAVAANETFALSGPSAALFTRAEEARRRSQGLFDARLGALVRLWGFDDDTRFRSAPPALDEISRLADAIQRARAFRAGAAYGPAPAVQWDFGGLAKGAAVDEAVAHFKQRGIHNAIVNAGGNLRVAGKRGEAPWRIGIRNPRGAASEAMAYLLSAGDEAIMTSGDYERYFEHDGRRYHHILDPRTGMPATGLRSVTVVHADAAWADAASTALFVAGAARWREIAAAMGIDQALVVTDGGEIVLTESLQRRLKFLGDQKPHVVP